MNFHTGALHSGIASCVQPETLIMLCFVTRNIQAATVTIDSCGLLKLSDFGIARFLRHMRDQAQDRPDCYSVRGSA